MPLSKEQKTILTYLVNKLNGCIARGQINTVDLCALLISADIQLLQNDSRPNQYIELLRELGNAHMWAKWYRVKDPWVQRGSKKFDQSER